jgi:hypothetical protein
MEQAPPPRPVVDLNTFDGVVADLVARLDEQSKAELRKTPKDQILRYHMTWGMGIRNHYGLWSNQTLLKSCAQKAGRGDFIHPDSASTLIMTAVWEIVTAQQ